MISEPGGCRRRFILFVSAHTIMLCIMKKDMKKIHLSLVHAAVGYNGKALIRDIEIGVDRGEIITLIGPNGAGKSTILRTITRQLKPVEGGIFLTEGNDQKNLEHFSPGELARRMAVVLTGRLQAELMTCRDVAAMGRYPYTGQMGILSEADERKVEQALAAVHALHLSERPFEAVSDGERQRILLARAICQEPEIIVLDEPTSFLDIRHKLELLSILHSMARKQGITVVMSLHEIDLAMKISDRVICVRGGEIFACGKPSEVLDDETVRRLYDLDPALGGFDTRTGSLQLCFAAGSSAPPAGLPEEVKGPAGPARPAQREKAAGSRQPSRQKTGIRIPRLMIAAPASGSGKTLITCGLLRLLQEKGLQPAAFKCGPDYIDPMFHRTVLGVPSRNLDTWFLPGKALSRSSYSVQWVLSHAVRRCGAEIALMEGVMGYYDGTGSSGTQASSRELALQTQTPAILVVDAKGMSRSIVPLLQGFVSCEKEERRIRGVILNRISAGMFPLMKKWIEEDTDLQVIGFVPQDRTIVWESRHLGLVRPEETAGIRDQIGYLASIMEKTIDVEALLALAQTAPPFKTSDIETAVTETEPAEAKNGKRETAQTETAQTETAKAFFSPEPVPNVVSFQACKTRPGKSTGPRIAVAMDEAFGFYYEDNFELLRECGADLVFFSPLHDKVFPPADGLILGGGYPELYAQTLAENASMKAQIRAGAAEGMPILAECGGFMYLQEYLEIPDPAEGKKPFPGEAPGRFSMCGILPGICRMTDHLVRFGYVELENREENPQSPEQSAGPGMRATNTAIGAAGSGIAAGTGYLKKGHRIRGHEFHYFDSTENGDACTAYKPGRTRSWGCMVVQGNIMAGFPHLYYRSDPAFAAGFVDRCRQYGDREGTEHGFVAAGSSKQNMGPADRGCRRSADR